MSDQKKMWTPQYARYNKSTVYPTEWVIRTLAGGNYPHMKLDKSKYKGKTILDMSCGDGRNLHLLLNLGFKVYASEISDEIVDSLKIKYPEVEFRKGLNNDIDFPDDFFDYVLSCASCYYLEENTDFQTNMSEIGRVLKTDGYFIGNVPDLDNSVVLGAELNSKNEATIANDPFGLRNGYRFQVFPDKESLQNALTENSYYNVSLGSFKDDFYGLMVSGFLFVCQKR